MAAVSRSARLADAQVHVVKAWLPHHKVHSAPSIEDGGWQVYGNFLIHDGPDNDVNVHATNGCMRWRAPASCGYATTRRSARL